MNNSISSSNEFLNIMREEANDSELNFYAIKSNLDIFKIIMEFFNNVLLKGIGGNTI